MSTAMMASPGTAAPRPHRVVPDRLDAAAQALAADPAHLNEAQIVALEAYRRFGAPLDELVSLARVGLVEAARRYRPEEGVRFGSFARHRMMGEIIDEHRRLRARKRRPAGGVGSPGDTPDVVAPPARDDSAEWMGPALGRLAARDRAMLLAYLDYPAGHGVGASMAVARRFGTSERTVQRSVARAVTQLRADLAARGITRPEDLL